MDPMTCPCGCTDEEQADGMAFWHAVGLLVFGVLIAELCAKSKKREDANRNASQD